VHWSVLVQCGPHTSCVVSEPSSECSPVHASASDQAMRVKPASKTHTTARTNSVSSNWICQANFPSSWGHDLLLAFHFSSHRSQLQLWFLWKKKSQKLVQNFRNASGIEQAGDLWAREEECRMLISLSISSLEIQVFFFFFFFLVVCMYVCVCVCVIFFLEPEFFWMWFVSWFCLNYNLCSNLVMDELEPFFPSGMCISHLGSEFWWV